MKFSNERKGRTSSTKSDDTTRAGPTVDGDLPITDECIGLDDGLNTAILLFNKLLTFDF